MAGAIAQTRAGQWPATPNVEYRLAGRLVTRDMYHDVQAAKRMGLRVTMTTPGTTEMDDARDTDVCGNCGGLGRLYLQSLVAGPFKEPPAHNPVNNEHVGFIHGSWYKMTLKSYHCPVCHKEILL